MAPDPRPEQPESAAAAPAPRPEPPETAATAPDPQPEPPETSKAIAAPELCAKTRSESTPASNAPIRGSLCSFEHPREPGERELAWLAERQHGCLHRRQLTAAGVGRAGIRGRVKRGQLHRLFSDVYLYGSRNRDPLTMSMAVALRLRGDGLINGASAAWIWEMSDMQPDAVEAILIGRGAHALPGVTLHRSAQLHPKDIRWRKGLPVTAPARTLIDFAGAATRMQAESALAMLRRRELASDAEIEQALDRLPDNHPGKPVVRELLQRPPGDLAATKSLYERKLRRLLRLAKLPAPISNHTVEGEERDLVWLDRKLILEFDGWEWHKDKFENDRRRDNLAIAAGWRVMRLTADRIDTEPYAVIAEIAAARAAALGAVAAGAVAA